MTNQLKDSNEKTNPVVASVAGAIVGASIGATGALILRDKKNREKVKEVLNQFKDSITGYSEKKKNEVQKSLKEGEMKAKKIGEIAKDSLAQGALESKKVVYATK